METPLDFFVAPARDLFHGMDKCLEYGTRGLFLIGAGLIVGWWIYVPVHELMHALACLVTGGTVSRLEINPLYGGVVLASVFPFVVAGGEYAGRLAGFDTGGNDLIYLATVFGPYLLTLLPGVWAFRRSGARGASFLFGFWVPWAFAPFISLTGDAYELGSILVTQLPPWASFDVLRSDDLILLVGELAKLPEPPWIGAALSFLVGVLWAFATYALARWLPKLIDGGRLD